MRGFSSVAAVLIVGAVMLAGLAAAGRIGLSARENAGLATDHAAAMRNARACTLYALRRERSGDPIAALPVRVFDRNGVRCEILAVQRQDSTIIIRIRAQFGRASLLVDAEADVDAATGRFEHPRFTPVAG